MVLSLQRGAVSSYWWLEWKHLQYRFVMSQGLVILTPLPTPWDTLICELVPGCQGEIPIFCKNTCILAVTKYPGQVLLEYIYIQYIYDYKYVCMYTYRSIMSTYEWKMWIRHPCLSKALQRFLVELLFCFRLMNFHGLVQD